METQLFQMYDTDKWGTHSSRTNIGVFSSITLALQSLCNDPDRLKSYFKSLGRLFIEKITVDETDGYSQVFDSDLDDNLDLLKKIMFFESIQRFGNDLGFLDIDPETDIDFDINSIKSYEDVSDELIEEYINEHNSIHFIEISFID
jgi:hypothetical protein